MKSLIQILVLSVFFGYGNLNNQSVPDAKKIYILKHKWHTGIILKTDDIKIDLNFLIQDFGESKYIEIGWGDKDFYMAQEENAWLAFKAAIWPTEAVLHVAEIKNHPLTRFENDDIIEIELVAEDLDSLVSYIKSSFYMDEDKRPKKLGHGLYGKSWFYLSKEKYHLFKTCNIWTARGLKTAGVRVKPIRSITSNQLFKQLKEHYK